MRPATDSASFPLLAARLFLRLGVPALCMLACGCASGTGAWRSSKDLLSGSLWKRPQKTDPKAGEKPGYDLYAARAADSLPADDTGEGADRADRTQLAGRPARPGRTPASRTEALARAQDDAVRPSAARGRASRRSEDTNIRVTLGRPESLPTLGDAEPATGPMLASATVPSPASSQWKRPSEPDRTVATASESGGPRPRPGRREAAEEEPSEPRPEAEPEPEPEPAPRRVRSVSREDKLKTVLTEARTRLDKLGTYQVNITRVERVNGQLQPEEEAILSIRRKPQAVRLEWPKGPSKGREVIYSAQLNNRTMYVNMGPSSMIPRMNIPVDSPLALRNSRHPITEAGFDTIFNNLFKHLDPNADFSETGKLVYKGLQKAKGLDKPCHLIERVTAKDETWQVYLDPTTVMPVLVVAFQTSNGDLIERYSYRDLRANPTELAAADAFDPDKRWGEAKGLFSRLARTPAAASSPSATR
jgi:hypothetical protein